MTDAPVSASLQRPHGRRGHLALIAAIAAVAGALAFAIGQQTPVGRIEGEILDARARAPVAGAQVVLTPADESSRPRLIYAVSDARGRFSLAHVPAGEYRIAAYRDTFAVDDETVRVIEGRTATVALRLTFSRPRIQLVGPRRHFTTAEPVTLPVRGYVETGSAAPGRVITMRVYRARLSALLRDRRAAAALSYGEGWRPTERLPAVVLRPADAPPPTLVFEQRFPITGAGIEGFYTQTLDAGRRPPGLYLVEAHHAGAAVSTWMLVSDTALVLKRAPGEALAFVADALSGAPVAGSAVRLYRGGAVVAQGVTGTDGLVRLPVRGDLDTAYLLAVAQRGDDEAVVGRTEYSMEGAGPFTLHAYTDRPIYRPGQRIAFKGIVRRTLAPGEAYAVPAGQPVAVELRDPQGEPVLRQRLVANAYGSFAGHADLSPEAPTGPYSLVLSAGGSTVSHDVVVAAYRKPEFSVTVSPAQARYMRGEIASAAVSARFYFGAPVAGAVLRYAVYRTPDWYGDYLTAYGEEPDPDDAVFAGYGGYGEAVAEGETRLDDQGKATLTFRADVPEPRDGPQHQIFTVQVVVRDPSGREVAGEAAVRVVPGDLTLALRPEGSLVEPGRPARVRVLARDLDRRPAPGVRVTLQTAYERWDAGRREYVATPFDARALTVGADGTAAVELAFPRSGAVRLQALAHDARGRPIRASTWLWVADASAGDLGVRYTDLSLQTDRRRYRPGEVARVLLNAGEVGPTVLLTIEGTRLHRAFVVPLERRTTVLSVPILAEYGPNVYLSALYVKDRRLARGEVGLSVAVPERELTVTVRSDRPTYEPGERATYTVEITDTAGRPQQAEFSLAVVDEAIYALREDDPRALVEAFYPRRWNQVRTSFSFELWYLGDADKGEISTALRRRFEDTAGWFPSLVTDTQGRAVVALTLPDNLTTWRATVLAHTKDTRLGRGVHTATVSRPFFVRVETPRLFSQHDRSRVLVTVHNETDAPLAALVRFQADGLEVDGPAEREVTVPPRRAEPVSWEVVARRPGEGTIRVAARTITTPVQTDGVELVVPVRPRGRTEVTSLPGDLTAGRPAVASVELDARAIPEATSLEIRLTPSVTDAAVGALEYLIGYPYGCVEQTMSRFLPTVLVQRVMREAGRPQAELEARIPAMVRDGLTRLYRAQHESGGWGWWEFGDPDPWMTAYVLSGLATARAEGFPVRDSVLASGRKAALDLAGETQDGETRMFLLYATALAGDPDGARAARARLGLGGLRPEGLAYAVLLDRLVGRDPRPAFSALMQRAVTEDGLVHWPSADRWDWNDRMATALGLRALLAVTPSDARVEPVVRWLMLRRTESYWGSTRDTSWVLAALADYLRRERGPVAAGEVRVRLNGRLLRAVRLDAGEGAPPVLRVPASQLRPGSNEIILERTGGTSRVFYTVALQQVVAADTFPALSPARVRVTREYLRLVPRRDASGNISLQAEPTRDELRAGDQVLVRLTITTPAPLAYVIIEDPFPAGFEATERGRAEVEVDGWQWWWDYTDVRDDRIAIFAREIPAGTHMIEYNVRAQTPGAYQALPAVLQGMYAPRLRAESAGARVVVR
ncbi:MAG: MG2 domain-containing protein [Armatimonadota bacterium]|nr:MG2 domain-containing protein [Armatimonadota bacterium]